MSPAGESRKIPAKPTPEKKIDFGQKLAKRRSQDFASKIQGWNQAGGGVVNKDLPAASPVKKTTPTGKLRSTSKSKPKNGSPGVAKRVDASAKDAIQGEDSAASDVKLKEGEVAATLEAAGEKGATTEQTPTPKIAKAAIQSGYVKMIVRDVDLEKRAWVRRKSKATADAHAALAAEPEVKHAGTPKKRVVSDSHWRRDRPSKESTPTKEKDLAPTPLIVRTSIANVGLKVPPSSIEYVQSEPDSIRPWSLPRATPRSASKPENEKARTPDHETRGPKALVSRRKASPLQSKREKDGKGSVSSVTASSSADKPSTVTDITSPASSLEDSPGLHADEKKRLRRHTHRDISKRERTRRHSSREKDDYDSTPDRHRQRVGNSEHERSRTTIGGRQIDADDQINNDATPPVKITIPPVYGTRIEGWLAGTSDPFVEKSSPSLAPEPLTIPKKKTSLTDRSSRSADSTSFGNDIGTTKYQRRERSHQDLERISTEDLINESIDQWSDASPTGTPSLKRSGARRTSCSPVKGRHVRGRSLAEVEASAAAESPTTRTNQRGNVKVFSLPERHIEQYRLSPRQPLSTIDAVASLVPGPRDRATASPEDSRNTHKHQGESVVSAISDGSLSRRQKSGLKRRVTKHEDLMSVLSTTRDDGQLGRSRGTLRGSRRQRSGPTTVGELMNEISRDELKYQRELRTLVEGVIPVLLQYALASDKDSRHTHVFSQSSSTVDVTKPIVDMGIALERLKTAHRRIPMHEPEDFVSWAEGAVKVYRDYIQSWRMGFKDVVVNLAPAKDDKATQQSPSWEDEIPRNQNGDMVDGDGERVDLAHLLKRPLARVKNLSKTLRLLGQMQSTGDVTRVGCMYEDLVTEAKERVNSENARLEDEAAANIDPSRARDPRSLAPITGVSIDPTRCVRARDYFDMDLVHSSGQQLCCKVELIYRDDAPGRGSAGDILFCEVSTTGRWLLFPPMPPGLVSARKGDTTTDLIVMIRGFLANAQQWREVMKLQADQEQTCSDWLQMLGSSPMPPARLPNKSGFNIPRDLNAVKMITDQPYENFAKGTTLPSARELEVPLGERPAFASAIWDGSEVNSVADDVTTTGLRRSKASRHRSTPSSPVQNRHPPPSKSDYSSQPDYYYEQPRRDRYYSQLAKRPVSSHARSQSEWTSSTETTRKQDYSVWMPQSQVSDELTLDGEDNEEDRTYNHRGQRPQARRRPSSVPSHDIPSIPKVRRAQTPTSPESNTPQRRVGDETSDDFLNRSLPGKAQKRFATSPREDRQSNRESNDRPMAFSLKNTILPALKPAFLKRNRRPSSPLKHEYDPASEESYSESDASDMDDGVSLTSESTVEEEEEVISTVGDLKAFEEYSMRPLGQSHKSSHTLPVTPDEDVATATPLSPSPQRTPKPTLDQPAKLLAGIFSWSDRGLWESLHPEECFIYVTPGLIEAFDITQASAVSQFGDADMNDTPSARGVKPLVALELTPLVPLRRGTAVDISIRSPPSAGSLIRTGSNVMFRSKSPEDCEKLYHLLNRARIDNPTYIALQHAQGPVKQSNWSETMDRRNALRTNSGSWWHLRSRKGSTYRSNGSRPASIAVTESSVGTMNSAFSALRRFSGGNRIWNIAKSTITSRDGTRSSNSESLSSGWATPMPLDPRLGTPLGITNAKIRLYIRESPSKWRDLGSARLSVMLPPRQDPAIAANPKATGLEKRIIISGKSHGELLLDATLDERCFERVARTGIAVSVWEENTGPNGEVGQAYAVGGVASARSRVYMVQMKSERDAAYTFGLVGKLRY